MAKEKKLTKTGLGKTLYYPLITEKAVGMIESQNKLAFVVRDSATRTEIKQVVEEQFQVKVVGINLVRDRKGRKKVFVKLDKKFKAGDIAIKLGVL
ncbi:50S ribosomal protein L23 [Candidatus Micrarchaeota archaeon]|nr:50S ribosomal protein L23 [Candidatus Micrarchaeota archaeon]MBU1930731.1 50S ribosomal protein L23 [Candidatus Micrarchaeota archaeon]